MSADASSLMSTVVWLPEESDMARISLNNIRHSYMAHPKTDDDYALKRVDLSWDDGVRMHYLAHRVVGRLHY